MRLLLCSRTYFNPRSHERSDGIDLKSTLLITYFNPRSHERSDYSAVFFIG